MKQTLLVAAFAAIVLLVGLLASADDGPVGKYTGPAKPGVLKAWKSHFRFKRDLVPALAPLPASTEPAIDFRGDYRFGIYDYDLHIEQSGNRVSFRSGGVDEQKIGGAFDTHGEGFVRDGKIHARWWCFDISRNYANTGGAEIWFTDGARHRIQVRYYHDADEKIEEGYGVRLGTAPGEKLHYRVRVSQPVKEYPGGVTIRGTVKGLDGEAIADAVVMRRHEERTAVRTDTNGRFALTFKKIPAVLMISAAARGYRNAVQAILFNELRDLDFILDPVGTEDDPRYAFVSPVPDKPSRGLWEKKRKQGSDLWRCGNCHRNSYDEWKVSRHAFAARNEITKAVFRRDFLPALEAGKAHGDAGLCSSCHAPQAALDGKNPPLDEVRGVALHGNHCDFCHKVHHVDDIQAAGVRGGLALRRPSPDNDSVPGKIKRIFGTLADSDYRFMGPVFNPFHGTSVLCAGCHQYTTRGIAALNTYEEWKQWAAGRRDHDTCQSCHMAAGESREGKKLARRICINALRRPREQIHTHAFTGREKANEALQLKVAAQIGPKGLMVTTDIETTDVGHKVPTGSSDKHLLLVVTAGDPSGKPFPLLAGTRVPGHAGGQAPWNELDAALLKARRVAGDYAHFPGAEFALVLADGEGLTHVPFWRATRVVRDTRLEPDSITTVNHRFGVPKKGGVIVRVELYHRLRIKSHDVAKDVEGAGVRPLDLLVAAATVEVR